MNAKQAMKLVKDSANAWVDDRAPSMGAALSYYTVFSIAPLLLIVIAVAGLVFGTDAAQGAIVGQLQGLLGERAAQTIQDVLRSVSEPHEGVLATLIGVAVLLLGATTVFAELQDDLDRVWKAPARAKPTGVWGWVRSRILSFGIILAFGFLLLVSLVASASIAALGKWWGPAFGDWEALAHAVNFVVSFALITVMFALIYRFMPHVKVQWRDVWIGSVVTALLFSIGKLLIGLYIGKSSVASGFGAAGSLAILLVWVYYSAQVFLLGAEFTRVFAQTHGSLQTQAAREDAGVEEGARQAAGSPVPSSAPVPVASGAKSQQASVSSKPLAAKASRQPEVASGNVIQRHLMPAAALAAALGAVTVLAAKRWRGKTQGPREQRRPVASVQQPSPRVRTAATPRWLVGPMPAHLSPTRIALGAGSSAARLLVTLATSALAGAVARGFKRGSATAARRQGREPATSS
jgi:membrane protein